MPTAEIDGREAGSKSLSAEMIRKRSRSGKKIPFGKSFRALYGRIILAR